MKKKYDSALEILQGMQRLELKGWTAIDLDISGKRYVVEYEKED